MNPSSKINISLIIPSFNNQETIVEQINQCESVLKEYCDRYNFYIVDDKSSDNTPKLLLQNFKANKRFNITLNRKKLGITKNSRKLYEKADLDYILLYKADGNYSPRDIEKLIKKCIDTKSDIVIGVRKKKNGYSWFEKSTSFLHNFLPKILFGVKTLDAGGIKILRRSILPKKLTSTGQFFEAEIIIRTVKSAKKVSFVDVSYKKNKPEVKSSFKNSFLGLKDILTLWFGGM